MILNFLKSKLYNKCYVVKDFAPKGKEFVFNFNQDTCDKLRTGSCRITDIAKYKDDLVEFEKYSKENKCTGLAYSILKKGFKCKHANAVLLIKYNCGHYRLNNGRHRTCLAGKLDLSIRAEVINVNENCDACNYDDSSKLEIL